MLIIATLGSELGTGQSHQSAKRAAPVLYADCQLCHTDPPKVQRQCSTRIANCPSLHRYYNEIYAIQLV
jgi:hypothetical protein